MSFTLTEYATVARSTAIYREDRKYEYPSLGIGGEIGELCEKIDAMEQGNLLPLSALRKEVGDVLWYVVNTALDAGVAVEELVPECCAGVGTVTFQAIQDSVPDTRPLVLAGISGRVCELAKKYVRDDANQMSQARRLKVHMALIELLLGLGGICNRLGVSFEEAARENLDKLLSRQARGVLQGSGDNR